MAPNSPTDAPLTVVPSPDYRPLSPSKAIPGCGTVLTCLSGGQLAKTPWQWPWAPQLLGEAEVS